MILLPPQHSELKNIISNYSSLYDYDYFFFPRIFKANTPDDEVYAPIFYSQGVIIEYAHGYGIHLFKMGDTYIKIDDEKRFQFINPLFISGSCDINDYMKGPSLVETFLKESSDSGPVTITMPPTLLYDRNFWDQLYSGYTIGEAFYNDVQKASLMSYQLFGEPSLVIIDLNLDRFDLYKKNS